MTDHPPDREELASAYVDGEATPAEMARVEADPALVARAAELRRIRERLAVDGPPSGMVEDHVGVALAAFDERDQSSPAPVTDLGDRQRRRRLYERVPLGAVAAAVLVLALVGALTQIDLAGDEDDTAAVAGDDSAEASDAAGGGSDEASGGLGAPAPEDSYTSDGEAFAPTSSMIRRAFADIDALADHAEDVLAEQAATSSTTATQEQLDAGSGSGADADTRSADPCDAVAVVGADPETVVLVLPAVVAGQEVTALVTEDDGRRLRVVDDTSCEVVDDRTL